MISLLVVVIVRKDETKDNAHAKREVLYVLQNVIEEAAAVINVVKMYLK